MRQPHGVIMGFGEESDVFMSKVYHLRNELAFMGETVSDLTITSIVLDNRFDESNINAVNPERGPDFHSKKLWSVCEANMRTV